MVRALPRSVKRACSTVCSNAAVWAAARIVSGRRFRAWRAGVVIELMARGDAPAGGLRDVPGINDGGARLVVLTPVTTHDGEPMINGGCGYDRIRLRKGVPHFAALLNQQPPLAHDVFGNWEDAATKDRTHLLGWPVIQLCPATGLANPPDSKSNLTEGDCADVKLIEGTTGESRTGRRSREGSRSVSWYGEACIAATRSAPVGAEISSDRPASCRDGSGDDWSA